jgi:hypothetical protein
MAPTLQVSTVPMSPWGRSFYNNLLAIPPLLLPCAPAPPAPPAAPPPRSQPAPAPAPAPAMPAARAPAARCRGPRRAWCASCSSAGERDTCPAPRAACRWALSPGEGLGRLQASGALSRLAVAAVLLSCALGEAAAGPLRRALGPSAAESAPGRPGLCISVTAFHCRSLVSATSYSLIGNMNKVSTLS